MSRYVMAFLLALTLSACGEEDNKADKAKQPNPTTASTTEPQGVPAQWIENCAQALEKEQNFKGNAKETCTCLAQKIVASDLSDADRQAVWRVSFRQAEKPKDMSDDGHKTLKELAKQCVSGQ